MAEVMKSALEQDVEMSKVSYQEKLLELSFKYTEVIRNEATFDGLSHDISKMINVFLV